MDRKTLFMTQMDKEHKVNLKLHGELTDRFFTIKEHLKLENDTEVCRVVINDYWLRNRNNFHPRLKHFNLNQDGVLILDPELDSLIQVYFKPDSIRCGYCDLRNCKHTQFALSLPEAQKLLQKKGWKPSV